MVRFLHTSDWQLGMTRHFLSEGTEERYAQARFDAIRTMGCIAKSEDCQFILVCGDTFESNQVDRKTVARALDALKDVPLPVFILPGNHDPLNAASVYRSSTFIERKPPHVQIIENNLPLKLAEGVELVGAPWQSKKMVVNPIKEALNALLPSNGVIRICAGHGIIDLFSPDAESSGIISVVELEHAIQVGKVQFVALGDRHSLTKVGTGDCIWYSGTPESTDFSETQSGNALLVEISSNKIATEEVRIGHWRFIERDRVDVNTAADVEAFRRGLEEIENKACTVLRLTFVGSLSLSLKTVLQCYLDEAKDIFGAVDVREESIFVVPDDADFDDLGFSGFADGTVKRLRNKMSEGGVDETTARDALMLLLRLARGEA